MKAIFPAGLMLACLLSVFIPGSAMAAAAPDKGGVSTSEVKAKPVAPAKKHTPAKKTEAVKKPTSQKKRPPIASKSKSASEVVRTTYLPPATLDLSLPPDMVKQLQPIGTVPLVKHAPLLPPMFDDKAKDDSPFQLNGRLLSNEMQLQMRKEEHREVEGAALDFQFKQ
ncbi:translation initiation factor 2 [Pseudomonas frederiksbergensis]|uniref:Translation initiation factor 2 n=1 Tax=Pseudomonas frederiksbergensis TaxID=104087 RepID=A0A1J0EH57_9PSED|nr:translation initiation factor 2 [Pseudomonas frederiksbergensis]APC15148.1 translation initiation factor 2 [Pseudomonas frederiksbergensis]